MSVDQATDAALWRALVDGYRVGVEHGCAIGYDQAEADMAAAWHAVADPVARAGPSFAELERKRWTVRGEQRTRETFGQAHRDDFTGRGAA